MHRLLPLLLLLAAPVHAAIDNMVWVHETNMQVVCDLMEVDCADLAPPLLIVVDFGRRLNALGLYPIGTNVILVSAECNGRLADKDKCDAVVAHEIAHYISFTLNPNITSCESEEIAWDVYNAYVISLSRYRLVRKDWKKEYPQCVKSPKSSTFSDTPSE